MRDSIFFIMDGSVASPVRMVAPMLELQRRGYKVVGAKAQEEKRLDFREFTALILQRPVSYNALELIERGKDFGIIVIVDLDDDFLAIPPEHPGYKIIGKGNPTAMQALELAYRAADYITVSTLELAHRYKGYYCDKPFKAARRPAAS